MAHPRRVWNIGKCLGLRISYCDLLFQLLADCYAGDAFIDELFGSAFRSRGAVEYKVLFPKGKEDFQRTCCGRQRTCRKL